MPGKMQDVASSGRTVVFVSHNMGAVQSLCSRIILMNSGGISYDGKPHDAIALHLSGQAESTFKKTSGNDAEYYLEKTFLSNSRELRSNAFDFGESFSISMVIAGA